MTPTTRRGVRWLGVAFLSALALIGCGESADGPAGGTGGVAGADAGPGAAVVTDKVDLLLMIDNSLSMADKQALLRSSVPRLVHRLVNPPAGATPVRDLHIGVITSSLGGHGADTCSPTATDLEHTNPTQFDGAHLLPSVREGITSHQSLGFLWWDPAQKGGGETNLGALIADLTDHIQAAGEEGCGFEASLEAWYRFLIDPSPPASVVRVSSVAVPKGVDNILLQQRKDFLRPDSAVAIVMLSDENDCSIVDGGTNWIAAQVTTESGALFHLPRSTSDCATAPDGPCCRSCANAESAPPPGCGSLAADPECQKGMWDDLGDHANVRCWQQKRRFGMDFLYPTRRYAEALTQPTLCPTWTNEAECASERVPNPLFSEGRDPRLVFLTGIVGVPWQNLATAESLNDPNALTLLTASELGALGRWAWLVPSCLEQVDPAELPKPRPICKTWNLTDQPDDPLMIESTAPRSGVNPATQLAVAGPGAGPMANAINGHEWNTDQAELQYACIFPLSQPRDCKSGDPSCDCSDTTGVDSAKKPLCQTANGTYSSQQRYAKAYPGTRHIQVLRDIGDQAVVASICPKSADASASSSYGYNAAMDALASRLGPVLRK